MARRPVAAGVGQAANLAREGVGRALRAPAFLANLAAIERPKKLRLRVIILRDAAGEPLARPVEVRAILAETARVLERAAGVTIVGAGPRAVALADDPAPRAALEPRCPEGLWLADLGEGGSYYRRYLPRTPARLAGYGTAITVFVVADVRGRAGCSLGPLGDYVALERRVLRRGPLRLLAHELGHSCGLPHSRRDGNLMRPRDPGEELTRLQRAILRGSRHVTSV
jgi:hypothetical protein